LAFALSYAHLIAYRIGNPCITGGEEFLNGGRKREKKRKKDLILAADEYFEEISRGKTTQRVTEF
jgi:hypothetical protein